MRLSRFAIRWSTEFAKFLALVMLILGSVSLAVAAPISVTIKSTNFSTNSPSPGPEVRLQVIAGSIGGAGSEMPPAALWLPGIPQDSGDRMLNYQIGDPPSHAVTIRKSDAATYGFDWDEFESLMLGLNRSVTMRFGVPGANTFAHAYAEVSNAIFDTGLFPRRTSYGLATFEMEEIRVQVDYYFWHPVLPGLRSAKVSFEVVGSGTVIPEPSAACLVTLATPLILLRRRRG